MGVDSLLNYGIQGIGLLLAYATLRDKINSDINHRNMQQDKEIARIDKDLLQCLSRLLLLEQQVILHNQNLVDKVDSLSERFDSLENVILKNLL